MENASKALLIAGGVLIAILVLTIGVRLFMNYKGLGDQYQRNLQTTEIQKFNVNFTKFEGRTDITIQEIVTLANFAREYNTKNGTNIEVNLNGLNLSDPTIDLTSKIKDDTNNTKYKFYRISPTEGMVEKIEFIQ